MKRWDCSRRYNRYRIKNSLNNFDKNLIKFKNSNPPKKWEDKNKEEREVTYYKCGKFGQYKINRPSLTKCKGK